MKYLIGIFFTVCTLSSKAQLFHNEENMKLVQRGLDYVYNLERDSANIYIDSVSQRLPNHPAVPMMRALNILWYNIPLVTQDKNFHSFVNQLHKSIRLANKLDDGAQEDPEAIFFEMSSRGLLAEYYADDGQYMKALGEAKKAYDLIKKGFDISDEYPEFLLTTGVYNYFRVKYPEKHPVYKPLVWFFRDGDVELGLQQIEEATEKATLTRIEAYIYLAYVYLRYEYEPKKAQTYWKQITERYRRNPYFKVKYYEALAATHSMEQADLHAIQQLTRSPRPYYQMAGHAFWGLYLEEVLGKHEEAIVHYRNGISAGAGFEDHGEHYRSLAYLGLGRIYFDREDYEKAEFNLKKAEEFSENEGVKKEVGQLLDQL